MSDLKVRPTNLKERFVAQKLCDGIECLASLGVILQLRLPRSNRAESAHAGEFAEAFHFGAGGHGAVLLHHGAHL